MNPNAPTNPGAVAPPPGTAPTIGNAGAYTPDWSSLISNDAGLKDATAALTAGAPSKDALNAQIAAAYESFGKNTDLATLATQLGMSQADLQNALGPDVQKLTDENTASGLSTTARLDKANTDSIRQAINALNARGMLNTGETAHQLDNLNLGYRQAQSDAYTKLLGALQGYQGNYADAQRQIALQQAQAYSDAAGRQYTQNQGTSGSKAIFDHVDSAGHAVYRGSDGNFYNADGSAWSDPTPAHNGPAPGGGSGNVYNPVSGLFQTNTAVPRNSNTFLAS